MEIGTKKKAGDWLLDVAKYILTAVVVTSFLGEFSERKWMYYGIGIFAVCCFLFSGFIIINDTEKKQK